MDVLQGVRMQVALSKAFARCQRVVKALSKGRTRDWEMVVTITTQWKICGESVSETTQVTMTGSDPTPNVTVVEEPDSDGPK